MVISLIEASKSNIPPKNGVLCATIPANEPLPIRYDSKLAIQIKELKKILFAKLYRHPQILRKIHAGKQCIKGLFGALTEDPRLMLDEYYQLPAKEPTYRVVADFIAGMSDRYAMKLYQEIFGIAL